MCADERPASARTSREGPRRRTLVRGGASFATLIPLIALASPFGSEVAHAQACCTATGVVLPARLRVYEDFGLGVQARESQAYGSFASDGAFAGTSSGDLTTQQNLFALWRALPRLQVGLLVPYVETWRRIPAGPGVAGRSEWGGFLGDVAVSARVEIVRPGDLGRFPAITLLGGLAVPTGRAPDEARNPLGTDASGTGSYEGTVGVEVEQTWTRWFASLDLWLAKRSARDAPGGQQSFDLRFTALAAVGYAFANQVGVAAFANVVRGGGAAAATAGSGANLDTRVAVATAGLAALVPIDEAWRLQGTLALDLPFSGWGRNQPATVGLGTSLVRVW
ncbi:MAG TPA: hypothetical protein VIU64_22665 [Polyangia bacterium]